MYLFYSVVYLDVLVLLSCLLRCTCFTQLFTYMYLFYSVVYLDVLVLPSCLLRCTCFTQLFT